MYTIKIEHTGGGLLSAEAHIVCTQKLDKKKKRGLFFWKKRGFESAKKRGLLSAEAHSALLYTHTHTHTHTHTYTPLAVPAHPWEQQAPSSASSATPSCRVLSYSSPSWHPRRSYIIHKHNYYYNFFFKIFLPRAFLFRSLFTSP
jgi:hypothetical protein